MKVVAREPLIITFKDLRKGDVFIDSVGDTSMKLGNVDGDENNAVVLKMRWDHMNDDPPFTFFYDDNENVTPLPNAELHLNN